MSNLYILTTKTHELVQKLAKQERIELAIASDFAWFSENDECKIHHKLYGMLVLARQEGVELQCLAIQAPQIRQILKAFEGVLGDNPNFFDIENNIDWYARKDLEAGHKKFIKLWFNTFNQGNFKTVSSVLCEYWLDGLDPVIDSEPEKVLEQLNEFLKSEIK